MNAAQIHLLLNHVPVLGTIFGILLLLFALLWRREESLKVSLAVFAVVGAAAIVVYLTGEPAEELLEDLAGFSHDAVERHEDASLIATWAAGGLGVAALAGLLAFRRRRVPAWFRGTVLLLALAVSGLMAWTAHLGGQVMHAEIRPGAVLPAGEDERER